MNQDQNKYNLNLFHGWQHSQLKLLKAFAMNPWITQTRISEASEIKEGSRAIGGKITVLARAKLIVKAGKDDNGQMIWQLNDEAVDRQKLLDLLKRITPLDL